MVAFQIAIQEIKIYAHRELQQYIDRSVVSSLLCCEANTALLALLAADDANPKLLQLVYNSSRTTKGVCIF